MSAKNFTFLQKLGQGAYSSVYKVQRQSDNQFYALKKVKLNNLSDREIQNALNQVRILASINCQNIVSYKQSFLQGKSLCIVMQFANDGDLYHKITVNKEKGKYFSEPEIWNVLLQIVKALKVLHELKIYHRDLKSANVFLSKDGVAKLGDMNVSKIAKNGLLYTQTGTPYYASPQVWLDQPYDDKSDIWSLGCVLYEMCSLQPPFKAEDMQGLGKVVIEGRYPPIPQFYSDQLKGLIKMMLQTKPKNRPSIQKIVKSALFNRKSKQLGLPSDQKDVQQLLQTIRIPQNLYYLTEKLPSSQYTTSRTRQNRNRSQLQRNSIDILSPQNKYERKKTLPRIDKILQHHQNIIKTKQNKRQYAKYRNPNAQQYSRQISFDNESLPNRNRVRLQKKNYENNQVIPMLPPLKRKMQ